VRFLIAALILCTIVGCGTTPQTNETLPEIIEIALSLEDFEIKSQRILTDDYSPLNGFQYVGTYADGEQTYLRLEAFPRDVAHGFWLARLPPIANGQVVVEAKHISYQNLPSAPKTIRFVVNILDKKIVTHRITSFSSNTLKISVDHVYLDDDRRLIVVLRSVIYPKLRWEAVLPVRDGHYALVALPAK